MTVEQSKTKALYEAWMAQKSEYTEATRLTESIRSEFEQGHYPNEELELLNQAMTRIGQSDQVIAGIRDSNQQWKSDAKLQRLTTELRGVVEHLLIQVNLVEQLARDSRDRLKPQISTQVKERRMLSAYSQT